MGLGAARTFPATLSLISNVFSGRGERARAIGLWGAIAGVAIAMGPIVGLAARALQQGSIFIAMAPLAAAAAVLVALVVVLRRHEGDPGGYMHLSRSESPLRCMLAAP